MLRKILIICSFVTYFILNSIYVFAQENTGVTEELFLRNGKDVYIAYPSNLSSTSKKVIMAIHGSGRQARNYKLSDPKGVSFYAHQRDLAVNNGFIFVVVSNGSDTWGTLNGLNRLLDIYSYVQERFNSNDKWILWATSAGGTLANQMVQNYPDKVEKVIGTFPVYDLVDSFDRLVSAQNVWKTRQNAQDHNPANKSELLTTKPYLIYHGLQDTAVPYQQHSLRFANEVNNLGGNVKLNLVSGGHSINNWNVYNDNEIISFIGSGYLNQPVKINSISVDKLSPQVAKTQIRVSTQATGGTLLEYEYWISGPNNKKLRIIKQYSSDNVFNWIPTNAGTYLISVHVKNKNSNKSYDAYKHLSYVINVN